MRDKNCKIYMCLRKILVLILFLSLVGYFLFCTIKNVILDETFISETNMVIAATSVDRIISKIRNLIVIETIILVLIVATLIYKLSSDRFRALYMDYLTEINNKRFYDMKLKTHIKRIKVTKKSLSVMMIDIDSFKKVNDSYGHDNGDIVLRHLAKIIRTNIRERDICCRFGGDEFVVILPGADAEQAKIIGERIIENLKYYPFMINGYDNKYENISVSIGISKWNGHRSAEKLSKCADKALYISKSAGEGKITVYE